MKKLAITAALLGATTLMAPSAHAFGFDWDWWLPTPTPPVTDVPGCDTLCDPNRADLQQNLAGIQEAINQIVNVNDANDIVQKAVNAGNLITALQENEDGEVTWVLNKDLGTITQVANVGQYASNLIDGNKHSDFNNLSQSATNVVNSITGATAWNISQNVANAQSATNTIWGGSGGYDAAGVADWDDEDEVLTQVAVNASNLVDISTLKNDISQTSNSSQDAINTAAFEGAPSYTEYHIPFIGTVLKPTGYEQPNVSDFGQSATNVTNSITVGAIELGGLNGGCACDFEISQYANANQYASNALSTIGNVNNIIQSATNVANSISVPSAD